MGEIQFGQGTKIICIYLFSKKLHAAGKQKCIKKQERWQERFI